jgi:putative dehydrogenase
LLGFYAEVLGRMGSHMCLNLLRGGFGVTVYDVNRASCDAVTCDGARPVASAAEVAAQSDVAILMVLNREQAEAAVHGEAGYAAGARVGSTLVVMSSLPPDFVRALAVELEPRGIQVLDAPVSGGVEGARAASLTIMASGSDAAFATAEPALAAMGKNIYRVGSRLGQGQTLKALNQAMYFTGLAVAAESLIAGSKAGIDPDIMVEVISQSSGDNWALRNRAPLAWRNDYRSGGSLAVANKDLNTALAITREYGMTALVTAATTQLFDIAGKLGPDNADDPEVVRTVEKLARHMLQPAKGPSSQDR